MRSRREYHLCLFGAFLLVILLAVIVGFTVPELLR